MRFWIAVTVSLLLNTGAFAAIQCSAVQETDAGQNDLPLALQDGRLFEYSDLSKQIYVSADYTDHADWILLSIQVGNSGSAVNAAFKPERNKEVAELIFVQYQPKTTWQIRCERPHPAF